MLISLFQGWVKASGLALLGLVVTIGIVVERCKALRYLLWTTPPINTG